MINELEQPIFQLQVANGFRNKKYKSYKEQIQYEYKDVIGQIIDLLEEKQIEKKRLNFGRK